MKTREAKIMRPLERPLYKRELYFAYGSNLNKAQFLKRCPNAREFGRFTMPDWRLVFNRVADILPSPGDVVEGALYEITRQCERALDLYEGFPRLYGKERFTVTYTKKNGEKVERPAMVYSMQTLPAEISAPCQAYLDTIRGGFDDWNIAHDTVDAAAKEARGRKCKAA